MTREAGDIGLVHVSGFAGRAIRFGQAIWGDNPAARGWEHAFIAVGDGTIIEAASQGAIRRPESEYAEDEVLWWTPQITDYLHRHDAGALVAPRFVGRPYNWLDYIALTGTRLHWTFSNWFINRACSDRTVICSQLVAAAYADTGAQIIPGRPAWEVTPGDLAEAALRDLK